MPPARLRLMTYNVHRCVGGDGRHDPERIAEVIGGLEPDVVVLQELDVGRSRTGHLNQPEFIASRLDMKFHFSPAHVVEDEHYGNAILSRLPVRVVHEGALPRGLRPWTFESRGALWAEVSWGEHHLQVIGTHLGLGPRERVMQAAALLGAEWLANPGCRGPKVICGDLNSWPGSAVCRRLSRGLRDAGAGTASKTFPSLWPLLRLDHVFLSPELEVERVEVPSTRLSRLASDHLPFVVDLRLAPGVPHPTRRGDERP